MLGANDFGGCFNKAPQIAESPEEAGMERRDVDVRAVGLEQRTAPIWPDPGNQPFEFFPVDRMRLDAGRQPWQLVACQVHVSAHAQEAVVREIFGWLGKE